jgi:hypothetical protein
MVWQGRQFPWELQMLSRQGSFLFTWVSGTTRAMASSFLRFLDHTRHITFGRTPLDDWSVRHRELYLTTHNTHKRLTSMLPGGIRTYKPSKRAASDLRLKLRGHRDRRQGGQHAWSLQLA